MPRKFVVMLVIDLDQAQAEGASTPHVWDWERLIGPEVIKHCVIPVSDHGVTLEYDPRANVITGIAGT